MDPLHRESIAGASCAGADGQPLMPLLQRSERDWDLAGGELVVPNRRVK